MTDRLRLENELRDALIQALGISYPLESIRDDLAIIRQEIVAAVRFNQAVQHDATQLIRVCWDFENGLESLREVALAALKGRKGLPRLSKAFEACLKAETEGSGVASISLVTTRNQYQIKDLPEWRKKLRELASRHSNAELMLHDALQRALREQIGEGDHRRRYPFLYPGRIEGWKDLLAHNESSDDCFDPPLIVPHPRLHHRAFVLQPLRDAWPEWRHPVSGLSADQLLTRLGGDQWLQPIGR